MYLSSWSGGKDSCFACYKALEAGYQIGHLINFISKEHQRVSFHGTALELIQAQSDLAGIPLYQKETTPDNYEGEFKEAVSRFREQQVRGMVFGDIYLLDHINWVERVCKELGIKAVEPLWERNTGELLNDFIASGFEAIIVCGEAKYIDREWIGKLVTGDFMQYLKQKPEVDICGEKGEYHTLVVAGPLFQGRIEITDKEVVRRNGHWFLDIKEWNVVK